MGLAHSAVDWVAPPGIAPIIISLNVAMDKPASRCRMSRRSSDEVQKLAKLSDKAARHAARLVSTDRDFSHGHPCKKDKGSTRHNWEREAAHLENGRYPHKRGSGAHSTPITKLNAKRGRSHTDHPLG